jgi:hypothetical protein
MEQYAPALGFLFFCLVPLIWSSLCIWIGIWYARYGMPFEVRWRRREDFEGDE